MLDVDEEKINHIIKYRQFLVNQIETAKHTQPMLTKVDQEILFPKQVIDLGSPQLKNVECRVLKWNTPMTLRNIPKACPTSNFDKKEKKNVKGVHENIFKARFVSLNQLLDSMDDDDWILKHVKKSNYYKHDRRTKRRSGYRGVSRNGASWQVLMMINGVKTYIGCYETEEEGALVYDIISILFKQRKARTNLSYTKADLLRLLANYDQDSKHFVGEIAHEFILQLQSTTC